MLEYAGEYRKTTYASMAVMLIGIVMNVLPFLFLYQLMEPLLLHENVEIWYVVWRVLAIGICGCCTPCSMLRDWPSPPGGLQNPAESAFLPPGKLERQPLGTIQEKGRGNPQKDVYRRHRLHRAAVGHRCRGSLQSGSAAVRLYRHVFVDWKLALLSLCALPLGLIAMGAMYQAGTSKMGAYYASAQKMNNTIVEYINGMEVVKVFNRDGESYKTV